MRSALTLGDRLIRFPQQAARLPGHLEGQEVGMQIRLPDLPLFLHELDRIANQLTVTLLATAFIIAIAWLIPLLDLA